MQKHLPSIAYIDGANLYKGLKEMFNALIIPNNKYCSHLLKRKNINMSFLEKKHIVAKIQKIEGRK